MPKFCTYGKMVQVPNSRIASLPIAFPDLKKHAVLKSTGIFFASSHGKGPVDRVGGTIKRIAANAVTSCKGMITDSSTFADTVESKSKVKVFHITSQDVADRMAEFGLCQLVKNAPALPGISGAHHLEFSGNIVIMYTNTTYTINNLPEDTPPNLKLLMNQRSKSVAKC